MIIRGITVLPFPSIIFADAGTGTSAALPVWNIFPLVIIIVWSVLTGPPVPSITVTCVMADMSASMLINCFTEGLKSCACMEMLLAITNRNRKEHFIMRKSFIMQLHGWILSDLQDIVLLLNLERVWFPAKKDWMRVSWKCDECHCCGFLFFLGLW